MLKNPEKSSVIDFTVKNTAAFQITEFPVIAIIDMWLLIYNLSLYLKLHFKIFSDYDVV